MSDTTTGKLVRFTLDPVHPPPLSDADQARAKRLAGQGDEAIDYSDIPPSPEDATWTRPGVRIHTENKQQITLRLDADVVAFFKSTGRRYQTRINEVLRAYMQAHRHHD